MIGTLKFALVRRVQYAHARISRLEAGVRALLWMAVSGFLYCLLNANLRGLALHTNPHQAITMVYVASLVLMLPLVLRSPTRSWRPDNWRAFVLRGAVHWVGMALWMLAVTHVTLAETTAIGFTAPLFILIGATLLLKERFRWERGVACAAGFTGVLIVVAPRLQGTGGAYALLMLGAAAAFATSFLLSKRLTRVEKPWMIVLWQSLVVTVFSLPMAVLHWRPASLEVWVGSVLAAVLTVTGNYCVTKAFAVADISASQPAKFLDLVWASLFGWLFFSDTLATSTVAGATLILLATVWVARREAAR